MAVHLVVLWAGRKGNRTVVRMEQYSEQMKVARTVDWLEML